MVVTRIQSQNRTKNCVNYYSLRLSHNEIHDDDKKQRIRFLLKTMTFNNYEFV